MLTYTDKTSSSGIHSYLENINTVMLRWMTSFRAGKQHPDTTPKSGQTCGLNSRVNTILRKSRVADCTIEACPR